MVSLKIEQRVYLKPLVKLKKNNSRECFSLLKEVFKDERMSRSQVFERYKRFRECREELGDDECTGRPTTSRTDESVQKISKIV